MACPCKLAQRCSATAQPLTKLPQQESDFSQLRQLPAAFAGTMEGGYAWLTLNYLLGKLGKAESETIAAIDLGGGSVQQAFALAADEAKKAPDGYVIELAGGPKTYSVYVHR